MIASGFRPWVCGLWRLSVAGRRFPWSHRASGCSSAALLSPSELAVWLSVVIVMTVFSSSASLFGILGKDLLVLASCFTSFSEISLWWFSQKSPWLNLPHLRHLLVGFLDSSGFFRGWNFRGLEARFLCTIFPSAVVMVWPVSFTAVRVLFTLNLHFIALGLFSFRKADTV